MGIFGTYGAFQGLGKPSIKLEFEDNESLVAFSKKMQDSEASPVEWSDEEDMFVPMEGVDEDIINKLKSLAISGQYYNGNLSKKDIENEFGKGEPFVIHNNTRLHRYPTPVGIVNFTENNIDKLQSRKRTQYFYLIKPTLLNPLLVFEDRGALVYLKTFKIDGKYIFFVVPVGNYQNVENGVKSAYEKGVEYVKEKIKGGRVRYADPNISSAQLPTLGEATSFIVGLPLEGYTENGVKSFIDGAKNSLGAPGDTYIITDTRTRARKELQDTAALKKYDIRRLTGEELQKMQGDDPLLYEQIKSELKGYGENLGGYGDYYTVRDLRKRSRKEPGDVAANKNLQFTKNDNLKMNNFDRNLYELTNGVNSWDLDKVLKGTIWRRLTVKNNPEKDKYIAGVLVYFPYTLRHDLEMPTFVGYANDIDVDVNMNNVYNYSYHIDSRNYIDKQTLEGYIKEDYYKSLLLEAIKGGYRQLQHSLISKKNNRNGFYSKSDIAEAEKHLKYYKMLYSDPSRYDLLDKAYGGNFNAIRNRIVDVFGREGVDFDNLGRTANNTLYNNLDILDCRGMQPTYKVLDSYDRFFKPAANKNSLKGWGLDDTKKLIADTCRNHYKECAAIAQHLKGDCKMQSAFNLWHWLHHNIRYEYDREGREEVRTPARVWQDRYSGVDCDCLSVFAWCVLKCMGYDPAFELAAFKGKPAYSHIYINLDGIVVDRVWFVFNSRPPLITKTELFKVGTMENLGQLF